MDSSSDKEYGSQPSKRRRLNDPSIAWHPLNHEGSQAPPTPSNQVGYSHFAGALPSSPALQPTHSPSVLPYGVSPSPFHDQTWFGHHQIHETHTGHDLRSIILPSSISMEALCPDTAHDGQEPGMEFIHFDAVSEPEQSNESLSKVVCFGVVRKLPHS
jgi:hypothetical protein